MLKTNFIDSLRAWRSTRRLNRFLRDDDRSRAIVNFRGCSFFAGLDNKIEAALLRGPTYYDHTNFTAVLHLVRSNHICFDIGANIGVYSVVLARLTGSPRNVHAFEPVDHIRNRLVANANLNDMDSMNINPFALGAEAGSFEMFQIKEGNFRGGTSTFVRNENISALGEDAFVKRAAEVKTLDQYAGESGLQRVDFLKIDVEGFELNVLEGAAGTISKFHPTILFEYDETRHGQQGPDRIREFLVGHDYRVYEFTSSRDRLALLPFAFADQPRNRNLLCLNAAFQT